MRSTLMHSSANHVVAYQLFIYLNQLRVFLSDFNKFPVGGNIFFIWGFPHWQL
ncbi:uncharacterized protein M6B38_176010 [Iris pallida]|uniref:Uncharacterized protein n=1 Tax=Iris pallida TaxID=29817 RepID=A0AAX6ER75_IRIPA|nr:uncharacterized protein M6B38_176010 [Iris pallida]